jgi:hypothetical protein
MLKAQLLGFSHSALPYQYAPKHNDHLATSSSCIAQQPQNPESSHAVYGVGLDESLGRRRLPGELARYILRDLSGIPDKLFLQINSAFVCQDKDRPQAIRELMTEFGMTIIDGADAGVRLHKFGQVAYIPNEAERKLLCGPDATPFLDLELLVELVELQCRSFQIAEAHFMSPNSGVKRPLPPRLIFA